MKVVARLSLGLLISVLLLLISGAINIALVEYFVEKPFPSILKHMYAVRLFGISLGPIILSCLAYRDSRRTRINATLNAITLSFSLWIMWVFLNHIYGDYPYLGVGAINSEYDPVITRVAYIVAIITVVHYLPSWNSPVQHNEAPKSIGRFSTILYSTLIIFTISSLWSYSEPRGEFRGSEPMLVSIAVAVLFVIYMAEQIIKKGSIIWRNIFSAVIVYYVLLFILDEAYYLSENYYDGAGTLFMFFAATSMIWLCVIFYFLYNKESREWFRRTNKAI